MVNEEEDEEAKELSNGYNGKAHVVHEIDIEKLRKELSEVSSVLSSLKVPETLDSNNAASLIKELHDRVMSQLLENEEHIETLRSESSPEAEKSLAGI